MSEQLQMLNTSALYSLLVIIMDDEKMPYLKTTNRQSAKRRSVKKQSIMSLKDACIRKPGGKKTSNKIRKNYKTHLPVGV